MGTEEGHDMNPDDLYAEDGTPLVGRWPLDMCLEAVNELDNPDRTYDVAERAAMRALELLTAEVEQLREFKRIDAEVRVPADNFRTKALSAACAAMRKVVGDNVPYEDLAGHIERLGALTIDAALHGYAYEYAPAGGPRLMLNPSDVRVYVRPDYVDDVTRLNAEVQRLEDFRRDVTMALVTEDQDEERTDAEVVRAAREAVTLAEAAGHWLSATDYAAQMGEAAGNGEPDADYAQAADAAVAAADALRDATVRWVCREWTEPPPVLTIAGRDVSDSVKSLELDAMGETIRQDFWAAYGRVLAAETRQDPDEAAAQWRQMAVDNPPGGER